LGLLEPAAGCGTPRDSETAIPATEAAVSPAVLRNSRLVLNARTSRSRVFITAVLSSGIKPNKLNDDGEPKLMRFDYSGLQSPFRRSIEFAFYFEPAFIGSRPILPNPKIGRRDQILGNLGDLKFAPGRREHLR